MNEMLKDVMLDACKRMEDNEDPGCTYLCASANNGM